MVSLFLFCLIILLISINYNSDYVGFAFRGTSRQLMYRDFITVNNGSTVIQAYNISSLSENDDFPTDGSICLYFLL